MLLCFIFTVTALSCSGRCNVGYDSSQSCQCNSECGSYGNCCDDYAAYCDTLNSCANRVCNGDDSSYNCQCNSVCANYGDCCDDKETYCSSSGGSCSELKNYSKKSFAYYTFFSDVITVSNQDLLDASSDIWALDENAASYDEVVVNLQSTTSTSSTIDVCPAK